MAERLLTISPTNYNLPLGGLTVISPKNDLGLPPAIADFDEYYWQQYDTPSGSWITRSNPPITDPEYYFRLDTAENAGTWRLVYKYKGEAEKNIEFTASVNTAAPSITKITPADVYQEGGAFIFNVSYQNLRSPMVFQQLIDGVWITKGEAYINGDSADSIDISINNLSPSLIDHGTWRATANGLNGGSAISKTFTINVSAGVNPPDFSNQNAITIDTQPYAYGNDWAIKNPVFGEEIYFYILATNAESYNWQIQENGKWRDLQIDNSSQPHYKKADLVVEPGVFRCELTNATGTITSDTFTITIKPLDVVIDSQPTSYTANEGDYAIGTISVSATNAEKYEWQKLSGAKWVAVGTDTTTTSLPLNDPLKLSDAGQYRCVVSNPSSTVITDTVTLEVIAQPQLAMAFTQQPESQDLYTGDSIYLSFNAENYAEFDIQKYSNNAWTVISSNDYSLTDNATKAHAGRYRIRLRSLDGKVLLSDEFTITVSDVLPPSLETVILDSYGIHPTDDTGKTWAFSGMQRVQHYQTIRIVPRWNLNGSMGTDVSTYPLVKSFTATEIGNSGALKEIKTDWGNFDVSLLVAPPASNTAGAQLAIHFETLDGKSFDRTVTFSFA